MSKWRWSMALAGALCGCMSTKVALNPKWDPSAKPAYVDYMNGYFLGFAGGGQIYLDKICLDQKPYALQRVQTVEDIFLTGVTLGIYAPTTVKVWCGE